MGLTLKQMILNELDKHKGEKGYSEVVANIANYSSSSALKKVLKGEGKEFEKFNDLVNLVRFLFGSDEVKLMEQYSNEIDPCNKTARCMLEYLSCNRLLDSMKQLINKMSTCNNKDSREWVKVYTLQHEWQEKYYDLDVNRFRQSTNEIKTAIHELKVKLELLKIYAFYYNKNYKMSYELSKHMDSDIEEIKDDYIKSMYRTKLNEVLSYIELRVLNNPEESRKRSEVVIKDNIGLPFTSYANYSIGCSYMYTSYEKSISYLNESIRLYQSVNRVSAVKDVKEKIELVNVIWDKKTEFYSLNAKLLFEAKRDNLNDGDLEKFKGELDLSFYLLIKGINENNNDILLQSLIEFLKIGDTFLAEIPKIELLKRNYNKDVLNALIGLNRA
jgi:hypothetical protein